MQQCLKCRIWESIVTGGRAGMIKFKGDVMQICRQLFYHMLSSALVTCLVILFKQFLFLVNGTLVKVLEWIWYIIIFCRYVACLTHDWIKVALLFVDIINIIKGTLIGSISIRSMFILIISSHLLHIETSEWVENAESLSLQRDTRHGNRPDPGWVQIGLGLDL